MERLDDAPPRQVTWLIGPGSEHFQDTDMEGGSEGTRVEFFVRAECLDKKLTPVALTAEMTAQTGFAA
jgi:hypothetical protein